MVKKVIDKPYKEEDAEGIILAKYIRAPLNMDLIDLFADVIYRLKFFSFCYVGI